MKPITLAIISLGLCAICATGAAGQDGGELSLSIEQCREMALQNSSSAKSAEYDVLAAKYRKEAALWEYFPSVSISALGFWALNPMLEIGITDILGNNDFSNNLQNIVDIYAPQFGLPTYYSALGHGYHAGVSLTQPVYAGGRIVNGNRLARLGIEAAELQRDVQNRSTESEIDEYFWQVVTLQEKMQTVEHFIAMVENLNADVTSAYNAGLATEDDLLQVRIGLNSLKSSQVQLRDGIKLAKMNLLNSIGQDYTVISSNADENRPFIDNIKLSLPSDQVPDPSKYYKDEESIAASLEETRLLDLNVEAQRLQKKMALGEALPQVAVGGSYSYTDLINGSFNGLAFATVQIPITQWGKTAAEMKRLQTQIDKAESEREFLSSQLVLQVRQYWVELNSAWDQYQLALDSEYAANASYGRVQRKYEAGMATLSELLQSQSELRDASDKVCEALGDYRKALRIWIDISGQ